LSSMSPNSRPPSCSLRTRQLERRLYPERVEPPTSGLLAARVRDELLHPYRPALVKVQHGLLPVPLPAEARHQLLTIVREHHEVVRRRRLPRRKAEDVLHLRPRHSLPDLIKVAEQGRVVGLEPHPDNCPYGQGQNYEQ